MFEHPIFADDATKEKRREICAKCEHRAPVLNVCKLCGCVIPAKTKMKNTTCPKGKW